MLLPADRAVGVRVRIIGDTVGHSVPRGNIVTISEIVDSRNFHIRERGCYIAFTDVELAEPAEVTELMEKTDFAFQPSYLSIAYSSLLLDIKAASLIKFIKSSVRYGKVRVMTKEADKILIPAHTSASDTLEAEISAITHAYVKKYYDTPANHKAIETAYTEFRNSLRTINNTQRQIQAEARNIKGQMDAILGIKFYPMDRKEILKIAKRYSIIAEWDKDILILEWKNVRVGNDTEGYIKYKRIKLWLNEDFVIKRFLYDLEDFMYDSAWGLTGGHMHPHHNGAGICYGNRNSDFALYKKLGNYPFLLDLLNDSVKSYSPESPYISVTDLTRTFTRLKESMKKVPKPEEDDYELWAERTFRLTTAPNCPICNTRLEIAKGGICTSPSCPANPNATVKCPKCGAATIRGTYRVERHQYDYKCQNINCAVGMLPNTLKPFLEEYFTDMHGYDISNDYDIDELLKANSTWFESLSGHFAGIIKYFSVPATAFPRYASPSIRDQYLHLYNSMDMFSTNTFWKGVIQSIVNRNEKMWHINPGLVPGASEEIFKEWLTLIEERL